MPSVLSTQTEGKNENYVLCETKPLQHARERTYLTWSSTHHPCRMKMKEAGWFIARNEDNELVSVCLYCQKACKGWTNHHDPFKVHRFVSPTCVFVLSAHTLQTPSSPIVQSMPRREQVRPSSHQMAVLPQRINSFRQWPPQVIHPSFDVLAESGLFYNGHNTTVECFSCHGQMNISRADNNPMLSHTNRCTYARHLRNYSTRNLLHIVPSTKTYEYDVHEKNNLTFYYLRCITASTPGILLSVKVDLANGEQPETLDMNWKRLHPIDRHRQKINWMTSSDGPLADILNRLARNPIDLTNEIAELQLSTDEPPTTNLTHNSAFQCKTCLSNESSPHVVPIGCGHPGLCLQPCFSKWRTCVICGYTLGKSLRIFNV